MPNQLKIDPTRTTTLRNTFVADMVRRFKAVDTAINQAIVEADALGLIPAEQLQLNIDQQAWRFQTDAQKVGSFHSWLQGEIDNKILIVDGLGDPWTNKYVESAYKKGVNRAYIDSNRVGLVDKSDVFSQSKAQFLSSSFSAPETISKLELVSLRTFNELQGVTAVMSQQLSRELANGLANGLAPRIIARNMSDNITKLTNTRARVIARTEVIHAHAEGQLDTFERLGVKELGIMAEWSTAGDERVCPECGELEGVVMTVEEARGLLPRHPNCRCAYLPANLSRREPGQLWGRDKDIAIEKSIQKEAGKNIKGRSASEIRRRSVWKGKDLRKGVGPSVPVAKVSKAPVSKAPIVKAPISKPIIKEVETQTVYHGTSIESAKKIIKEGFKPGTTIGMSSVPVPEFIFVTPKKAGAQWYAKSNFRFRGKYKVVESTLEGKLFKVEGFVSDFEAMGKFAKEVGIMKESESLLNLSAIAKKLNELGYVGIEYKDSISRRVAYAVLPKNLEIIK